MRLLVLGGQLQGTEITYLAKEAEWEVTVIDRNEDALASRLCDHFVCMDVLEAGPELFRSFDLVLPAFEDLGSLERAQRLAEEAEVPFAFDLQAFTLSLSKTRSNHFLEEFGIRIPGTIDGDSGSIEPSSGAAPGAILTEQGYIVKPDCSSGSKGVQRYNHIDAAIARIQEQPSEGLFGQVFLDGPIYSIEVVCDYEHVRPFMVTEVVVNADYDCFRINAPADIPSGLADEIEALSLKVGKALHMKGIFDLEMVFHDSRLYVLEIDARMPSQTPIAVYHASGINLFEELAQVFLAQTCQESQAESNATPLSCLEASSTGTAHVVLQHVLAERRESPAQSQTAEALVTTESVVHIIGEGQLIEAPPLVEQNGFFSADVALVGKDTKRNSFYATLVAKDESGNLAARKMDRIVEELASKVAADD